MFSFLASCHLCLSQICFLLCAIKAVILFVCHTYKASEVALVLDLGVWAKLTKDTASAPIRLGPGAGLTKNLKNWSKCILKWVCLSWADHSPSALSPCAGALAPGTAQRRGALDGGFWPRVPTKAKRRPRLPRVPVGCKQRPVPWGGLCGEQLRARQGEGVSTLRRGCPRCAVPAALDRGQKAHLEGRLPHLGTWSEEGFSAGERLRTRGGVTREAESAGGGEGLGESRRGVGEERVRGERRGAARCAVPGAAGRRGRSGGGGSARAGAPARPPLNRGKAEAGRGAGAGGGRWHQSGRADKVGEPQERSGRARRQRLAAASGSPLTASRRTSPHHAEVSPGEGEHLLQTFLQVGAPVWRDACGRGQRAGLGSGGRGAQRGSAPLAQPLRREGNRALGAH